MIAARSGNRHWLVGGGIATAAHAVVLAGVLLVQPATPDNLAEQPVVLAEVLDQDSDRVRALQTYEAQRKPRVTKIQQRSAANASMFHRHTGLAQLATYGPMAVASRLSVGAIHRQQDWIYSFDAVS